MGKIGFLEDSVKRYVNQSKTDYSIFLNGEWGIGKTYYVKNTLIPMLSDTYEKKCIYFSLNGLDSLTKIKRIIILMMLNEKKNSPEKVNLINDLIDFSSDFELSGLKGEKLLNGFVKLTSARKINDMDFSKVCLIIDDMERLSSFILIGDFLGFLHDTYLVKGLKIILIGADRILTQKDPDYQNIKEKYIRYHLNFRPNIENQLNEILNEYESNNSNTDELYLKNKIQRVSEVFGVTNHFNLRTYGTFIEIFDAINKTLLELEVEQIITDQIFDIALMLTIESKKGKINPGNYEDIREILKFFHFDLKKYNDNEYAQYLKDKYKVILRININYLKSIFNFVVRGEWDSVLFKKEVSELYPSKYGFQMKRGKKDVILESILNYKKLEIEDLEKNIKKYLEFIETGIYVFYRYPYLLTLVLTIKEENYFNDLRIEKDISEIFNTGIELSVEKYKDELVVEFEYSLGNLYNDKFKDEKLVRKIISRTRDIYHSRMAKNNTTKLIDFFNLINKQGTETERLKLINIDRTFLFRNIVDNGYLSQMETLTNNGISWLEVFLREYDRDKPFRSGNNEKESLEKILTKITWIIDEKDIDKMKRARFEDLKELVSKCILHDGLADNHE